MIRETTLELLSTALMVASGIIVVHLVFVLVHLV